MANKGKGNTLVYAVKSNKIIKVTYRLQRRQAIFHHDTTA